LEAGGVQKQSGAVFASSQKRKRKNHGGYFKPFEM
jgi:hypothetical protein